MSETRRRRELARADRVLPGLWRLRLPLPWPGVPHVNAFAIAAGNGVVLVDTGLYEPGGLRQLELALDQAGLRLEHVRLLVCTHAHSDHYGLAGADRRARRGASCGCTRTTSHMTRAAADPERAFERRFEVARQSGVPADALAAYQAERAGPGLRHRGDRDARPRPAARAWRSTPTSGRFAGLRDARPRAVARGAPPARPRPAAVGRPPARPRLALLRLRLVARPGRRVPPSLDVVDELDVQLVPGRARPPGARRAARSPRPTAARSTRQLERGPRRARGRAAHRRSRSCPRWWATERLGRGWR